MLLYKWQGLDVTHARYSLQAKNLILLGVSAAQLILNILKQAPHTQIKLMPLPIKKTLRTKHYAEQIDFIAILCAL